MQLHQEHKDDVVPVTLSVDYDGAGQPEDHLEAVREVLENIHATGENVICSDPYDTVMAELDVDAVSVIRVYNRKGELVKTFPPGDYENDVIPFVKTMLRKENEASE